MSFEFKTTAIVLLLLLWPNPCPAQSEETPHVVVFLREFSPAGGPADSPFSQAIQSHVFDLAIKIHFEHILAVTENEPNFHRIGTQLLDENKNTMAVCWFDDSLKTLYLLYRIKGTKTFIQRNMFSQDHMQKTEPDLPENQMELAALLIRATLKVILSARATVAKPPTSYKNIKPRAVPRLHTSIAYVLQPIAKETPWMHGFRLNFAASLASWLRIGIDYRALPYIAFRQKFVEATFFEHAVGPKLHFVYNRTKWAFSSGAGFYIWYLVPMHTSFQSTIVPSNTELSWSMSFVPYAEFFFKLTERVALFSGISVDLVLNPAHYVIQTSHRPIPFFTTERWRPAMLFGIYMGFF